MNLDGYVRVSRVGGREGESFISPRSQRERIAAYAKAKGWKVGKWFEELDESGGRSDRPFFQEALARVERGESDGLIVSKADRFARSMIDALSAIKRIDDAGGQFVSVADNFDTSTPNGKLALTIFLAFAEFELDRIREGWGEAQRRAVERGVHVASKIPTGYRRGDDGRLEPDPLSAPVLADVFRRRAGGASWRELGALLMDAGVKTPYGSSTWATSSVSKLIGNPVYTGEARSGAHRNAAAHPPIVSPAEWAAAQTARSPSPTKANGDGSLLAGLLRCAGCRFVMKADRMTLADGSRVRIYRCRGEHAAGFCTARPGVMGRVIEPYVVHRFFEALGPVGILARASLPSKGLDNLHREVASRDAELAAWRDETRIIELGRDLYVDGLAARQQRLAEAERELGAALAQQGGVDLPPDVDLAELWPELTIAEQRRLLAAGLDCVVLRKGKKLPIEERVLVLFRGQGPTNLPGRGRRVPLEPFPWPSSNRQPRSAAGQGVSSASRSPRPKRLKRSIDS